jgi:hypothetical protein
VMTRSSRLSPWGPEWVGDVMSCFSPKASIVELRSSRIVDGVAPGQLKSPQTTRRSVPVAVVAADRRVSSSVMNVVRFESAEIYMTEIGFRH